MIADSMAASVSIHRGLPLNTGAKVFVRAATTHYVGRVAGCYTEWLVLDQCSWVAACGRFGAVLAHGLNLQPRTDDAEYAVETETEYMGDSVYVNRAAIIDVALYGGELPTTSIPLDPRLL